MTDMADDAYWNDDPNDPMPSHDFGKHQMTLRVPFDTETGEADVDAAMKQAEAELDEWFAVRQAWWSRRIARERLREHPHADTETIASNVGIDDA